MIVALAHLWAARPVISAHDRRAKSAVLGFALLFAVGCGVGVSMNRVASSLEATKALWIASCEPTPVVPANVCDAAHSGINVLIDSYGELNESLPEGSE